MTTVQNKKVG